MTNISVLKAKMEDLDDLQSIVNDAQRLKVSKDDHAWGDKPYTKKQIGMDIDRGNTYMVKVNGKNVGCVDLMWDDEYNWGEVGLDGSAGYLHSLAVHQSYRGMGLGEDIISWVEDQVRSNGRQFIRLDCLSDNKQLCAYYEKQGYSRVTLDNPKNKDAAYYEKAL